MVENERKDDNKGDSGGKSPKKLRVLLRTFGCQMNDRDSEHVIAQFLNNGYSLAEAPKKADVVLINTCSVRQHAEDRVWSELGAMKKVKKHNPEVVIGVLGCMAENLKNKIIEKMPMVDLVCGPNDLSKVFELVQKVKISQTNMVAVGSDIRQPDFYKNLYQADKTHSYVVIMEGCNNFCSYCVVPYVRGRERSRNFEEIIGEVKQLVKRKITSVTLLGQNVNSFNGGCSFPELLRRINKIRGMGEVSFVTSHPKDASVELFETMRDCAKVKKYLHLPIQSGSDRILKLMNRGYTRAKYLDLAEKYRSVVGPRAKLATDFIVGFPTETKEDFEQTCQIAERVKFNFAYIFKYSPRPKTKAGLLKDDVPQEVKKLRHKTLLDLQRKISKKE